MLADMGMGCFVLCVALIGFITLLVFIPLLVFITFLVFVCGS